MGELNKEIAIEWWMDHLSGELEQEREQKLLAFLDAHPDLRAELKLGEETWSQLRHLEEVAPSAAMDAKFEGALQGYLQASASRNISFQWPAWAQVNWRMGLAFTLVGLLIGYLVVPRPENNQQISQLSEEVMEMKKMMMLTLIEQPRAQERIKAVSLATEIGDADERVIEVLAKTLQEDDNVNVRLAAVESLLKYWSYPQAREILVASISKQDSPLVQVAIADAMLAVREKEAIGEFQKLIDDQELDEAVKMKLETTINQLKSI